MALITDPKNSLGVPRWMDAKAYPSDRPLSASQWRWEFLRRRPDYRKAWVDHFDKCQARYDEMDKDGLLKDRREEYRGVGSTWRDVCEPFGVERIAAPWLAEPGVHFWRTTYGWAMGAPSLDVPIESIVDRHNELEYKGIMLFAFDINRPFKEQAERVQHFFEARQREERGGVLKPQRQHVSLWPNYLRALDARDQGATFEQLWSAIVGSVLLVEEHDRRVDGNTPAAGHQLWEQAQNLMFKVTS
ncbi:hypothetical protein ASE11_19100 [Hydrogenophaga sp. Root209]|uniref:hypothetical protein n=1 Tax=Hydrogenophaga sp. Root209 TaxID=1736490 RepID=UPI0006F47DCF|nr:hypothetical protein [Hydrogenophaga sp. Root209]KRC11516.1 hypothetical protein ASE11_19100 [Hydrogenophaga sp. Root209]